MKKMKKFMQMNKKIILIVIIVLAIELSGHGIITSLFRLLNSMN